LTKEEGKVIARVPGPSPENDNKKLSHKNVLEIGFFLSFLALILNHRRK
jgi:hypothetical protein